MSDPSSFHALDRQREIYLAGLGGQIPKIPASFSLLEERARKKISRQAFAYVAGGAGQEETLLQNRAAFSKSAIKPRMLCDVSEATTRVNLFGRELPSPLLLAPIGVLEMIHPEADLAVGRADSALEMPYIFSNQASVPMEKVAQVMGKAPRWFQLYWSKSRDLVASLVRRAEHCGCEAIAVTLDTTMLGWRPRDLDLAYLPFLEGKGIAQYISDPVFRELMQGPAGDDIPGSRRRLSFSLLKTLWHLINTYPGNALGNLRSGEPMRAVRTFINTYTNPALTWDDLAFLREHTQLPILLKGILCGEDAQKALERGMDGIVVSNHGGRQVDGALAALEALPEIVKVAGGKIPLLFDSGVRGGADVFKALALGATAVCIGRPYAYGLAVDGEAGVRAVLQNLRAEFELTMRLAGCRSLDEITRENLTA